MSQEDDSSVADVVVLAPVDGPGLLLLAVGYGGDGVAFDTDPQPMPFAVGQLGAELDPVLLGRGPSLVCQPAYAQRCIFILWCVCVIHAGGSELYRFFYLSLLAIFRVKTSSPSAL